MIVQYLIGNEHLTSYDKMRDLFEYFPVNLEYEQKHHELELRSPFWLKNTTELQQTIQRQNLDWNNCNRDEIEH